MANNPNSAPSELSRLAENISHGFSDAESRLSQEAHSLFKTIVDHKLEMSAYAGGALALGKGVKETYSIGKDVVKWFKDDDASKTYFGKSTDDKIKLASEANINQKMNAKSLGLMIDQEKEPRVLEALVKNPQFNVTPEALAKLASRPEGVSALAVMAQERNLPDGAASEILKVTRNLPLEENSEKIERILTGLTGRGELSPENVTEVLKQVKNLDSADSVWRNLLQRHPLSDAHMTELLKQRASTPTLRVAPEEGMYFMGDMLDDMATRLKLSSTHIDEILEQARRPNPSKILKSLAGIHELNPEQTGTAIKLLRSHPNVTASEQSKVLGHLSARQKFSDSNVRDVLRMTKGTDDAAFTLKMIATRQPLSDENFAELLKQAGAKNETFKLLASNDHLSDSNVGELLQRIKSVKSKSDLGEILEPLTDLKHTSENHALLKALAQKLPHPEEITDALKLKAEHIVGSAAVATAGEVDHAAQIGASIKSTKVIDKYLPELYNLAKKSPGIAKYAVPIGLAALPAYEAYQSGLDKYKQGAGIRDIAKSALSGVVQGVVDYGVVGRKAVTYVVNGVESWF